MNTEMQRLSRKRQKIALACEECRARKIRCDGRRPRCSACLRKPADQRVCNYPKEHPRASIDRRLIQSFDERLAQLENQLTTTPPDAEKQTPEGVREPGAEVPTPELFSLSRTQDYESQNGEGNGSSINAMGVAHLSPRDPVSKSTAGEFYGRSSAASFLSHIQHRIHPINSNSTNPPPTRPRDLGDFVSRIDLSPSDDYHDYHLPPRHIADHLISLYYTRVHSLYPFLHWPTLMGAYRRLWMSDSDLRNAPPLTGAGIGGPECSPAVLHCGLNAVFALGAQFSAGSAQERRARARPFSHRARHLLRLDFLDRGDLALVQALLIMAQYLQSTNLPSRCWSVAGVAHRMAQGLGLHLESFSGGSSASELHREMRRRVWHGCVCLDIILGMTMGRPCLNSRRSSVRLPSMLEEERATTSDSVTDSVTDSDNSNSNSTLAFFVETIRLYKILDNVLRQVYDPWKESEATRHELNKSDMPGSDKSHLISCIAALDSDLDAFEATVPAMLRWSTDSASEEANSILQQQRNVLYTRFIHTRILLHRPLFVQLCQMHNAHTWPSSVSHRPYYQPSPSERLLFSAVSERCAVSCVQNSQTLVKHIHSTFQTTETGAPWFNSYYVYHSAMVLALAEFCPSVREKLDGASLSRSWLQCLEFLDRKTEHDAESHRYLRTLRDISTYVSNEGSGGDSGNHEPCSALQGLIVDHITNPCLDSSAASWLEEDAEGDMCAQFGETEYGTSLRDYM